MAERWSLRLVTGVLAAIGLVLLVAPSLVVVATSFTAGYSLAFPPQGLSLRWYSALLFDSPEIAAAFRLSLELAACATAIGTALGLGAALALGRRRSTWARVVEAGFLSPLTIPSLALGFGLLVLFDLAGAGLSFGSLLAGHVGLCAPYVLFTTAGSYAQLDGRLLDSSHSLGASSWFTFRRVVWPAVRPAVLSGAFFAFMTSFDNVALSLFLSDGRSEVLPVRLWHIIEDSLDVRAAAASGLLIAASLLAVLVLDRLGGLSRTLRRG